MSRLVKLSVKNLLERYYIPHHQKLTDAVEESLLANDHCLIIDGHSFPALPLPYELNQTAFRPDFCIGTDDFHTPEELVTKFIKEFTTYAPIKKFPVTF